MTHSIVNYTLLGFVRFVAITLDLGRFGRRWPGIWRLLAGNPGDITLVRGWLLDFFE
jgi:hypothetical protein